MNYETSELPSGRVWFKGHLVKVAEVARAVARRLVKENNEQGPYRKVTDSGREAHVARERHISGAMAQVQSQRYFR